MAKEDKVCDDDLDDYDDIQHEYDYLFNDFEKLMEKCKAYRKTIASLNLELEHAKKDYEISIDDKKNLQINLDNEKSKNEVLKLELDNKNEDLIKCMNENSALKLSLRKILCMVLINILEMKINIMGRNMQMLLAISVVE